MIYCNFNENKKSTNGEEEAEDKWEEEYEEVEYVQIDTAISSVWNMWLKYI